MDQQEHIYELELELLQPNPLQPRGLIAPDSLSELADSIRVHGVLEPLVVAKTPAGYQIIAGERRWRASKLAGLIKVPVIIRETSPQGMFEMAIVENVQRIDLNPLERAQAYRRLMDEFGLANQEIAERVSKSPAYISNTIRLLILPDALKDALMAGATSEGHARALAALEDPHLIITAYKEVLKRNLSVRGTEELVRRVRNEQGIGPKNRADIDAVRIINEDVDKIQENINAALSGRTKKPQVKCQLTGKRARLELLIDGEPKDTMPVLEDLNQAIVGYFNLLAGK
ncbi:MAG: ParB/RepB/Spo0J family partition protein [Candidatus Daviesbacteria bacterium]|nr:ParB/RepB/Spo0J family partition protein [Candidatus Daviesbacteria bacterium]